VYVDSDEMSFLAGVARSFAAFRDCNGRWLQSFRAGGGISRWFACAGGNCGGLGELLYDQYCSISYATASLPWR
jgi:hypothetical protein